MASLQENSLQLRLDKRRGTMSEVDRNQYEKQQTECITKAIKNEESPAKEKHVRRTIIGTWQERGNSMFWNVLGKQPLPSQAVLCWKSLTVLHKILREGHPNVLKDSYSYRKTLRDLFSVYRFQAGIYGPMICEYLKILQTKLEMHHKYPGIPGSLTFSQENPVKIPERDINDVFTFAVESLDYQDLLLSLEENVFKTLDKSRNNSQIAASQCRIATLVPLLKECSGVYDLLVYVVTKLHKNLPPETLEGHRQRFNGQHRRLKTFCFEAGALQYVTSLTAIPNIPDEPPDFLIHKYQPKEKKERRKEEPKPVQITPQIDERDILIEQLMREIEELRQQLEFTRQQAKEMENQLRLQIMKLQEELKRMESLAKQSQEENKFLKEQMESVGKEDTDAQEKAKNADEKFNKLKLLYGKLRQEHIDLLRKNAETKQKEDDARKETEIKANELDQLRKEILEKDKELEDLRNQKDDLEQANQTLKIEFDNTDQSSKEQILKLSEQINSLQEKLHDAESKAKNLENDLEQVKSDADKQIKSLGDQLQSLTTGKITEESARKNAEETISKLRSDHDDMKNNLNKSLEETKASLLAQQQATKDAEENLRRFMEEKNNEIAIIKGQLEQANNDKIGLNNDRDNLRKELLEKQALLEKQNADISDNLEKTQAELASELAKRKVMERDMQQAATDFQSKIDSVTADLKNMMSLKESEEKLKQTKEEELLKNQAEYSAQLKEKEKQQHDEMLKSQLELLSSTASECEVIIRETLDLFQNEKHETGTTCSAEYLKCRLDGLTNRIQNTTVGFSTFHSTRQDVLPIVRQLNSTCHHVSDVLIHGKATSHMASAEDSQNLVSSCLDVGNATLKYIDGFKTFAEPSNVESDGASLETAVRKMMSLSEDLIPKQSDSGDNVDNIVDEEMQATERMVADAASRIEELLNKSRKQHTGAQLEVNERILDSCTGLMAAIRELILKSKDLQDEIVAEGRGSASVKEFYKRHHKWTEGLLSAAKSVGLGATVLVDAADKVIERKAKFEELIVSSHEIAASTAQLVAASRVKASKNSKRLPPLMTASKQVGTATAGVVAAVRSGAATAEDLKTVPDYTKMTLTQAKRYEMDSQVKILELEDHLQKERSRLGELRKAHYQIAVELYGEEAVNMD